MIVLALTLTTIATTRASFVQSDKLLVSFDAGMQPTRLPRDELVPVRVGFRGTFENLDASDTPALDTMLVRLSRGGRIRADGLPRCAVQKLRNRTSSEALASCHRALVGEGTVRSALRFPDGRRLRSKSRLLLFNATHAIIMHIHTTQPLRGTFLVPMTIHRSSGAFGTVLRAHFPKIAAGHGYLTGFEMVIDRTYSFHESRKSFVVASCAAPLGLNRVSFELARVIYRFRNGVTIRTGTFGSCSVRH